MDSCIYCGKTGPFHGEESIVCSSLGGTKKLPQNFVCKNCNSNIFPVIESKFTEVCVSVEPAPCNKAAEWARIGLGMMKDRESVYRMIAKMTFNFLALVVDREYLYHETFDGIKKLILSGTPGSVVTQYSEEKTGWYRKYVEDSGFPENGHFISINSWGKSLHGSVGLFGGTHIFNIKVSDVVPFEKISDSIFICDWINKKDYTLSEFLDNTSIDGL